MTDPRIFRALTLIVLGCMSNVVFLELIIKRDSRAGSLITLAQFAFVSLQGLPGHLEWKGGPLPRLKERTIPLSVYALLTAMYFAVSLINNMALNYNISLPLHMVFRSSSLVASLLLGFFAFGKRYTPAQVMGVVLVSVGVVVTTLADSRMKLPRSCCGDNSPTADAGGEGGDGNANECLGTDKEEDADAAAAAAAAAASTELEVWAIGVAMLLFALIGSALLGQVQEWSYRKWTRNPAESKFYSHAMALPFFAIFSSREVVERVQAWLETETLAEFLGDDWASLIPTTLTAAGVGDVPILFVFLLGNVATQLVCITGVYQLTAVGSTLTCTMAVTVRKFLSLVLSVWYFANPFSSIHWLGTGFVFLGVLQYANVLPFARVLGFEQGVASEAAPASAPSTNEEEDATSVGQSEHTPATLIGKHKIVSSEHATAKKRRSRRLNTADHVQA